MATHHFYEMTLLNVAVGGAFYAGWGVRSGLSSWCVILGDSLMVSLITLFALEAKLIFTILSISNYKGSVILPTNFKLTNSLPQFHGCCWRHVTPGSERGGLIIYSNSSFQSISFCFGSLNCNFHRATGRASDDADTCSELHHRGWILKLRNQNIL